MANQLAGFSGLLGQLKIFDQITKRSKTQFKEINSGLNMLMGKKRGNLLKLQSGQIMKGGKLGVKGTSQADFDAQPKLFVEKLGSKFNDFFKNVSSKIAEPFKKVGGKISAKTKAPLQNAKDKIAPVLKGAGANLGVLLKAPFAGIGKAAKMASKPMGFLAQSALRIGGVPKTKAKAMTKAMGGLASTAMMGGAIGAVIGILMQLMQAMNPFKGIMDALSMIFGVYGSILEQAFIPVIEMLFGVMLDPAVIGMFQMLSDVFMEIVVAFLPLIQILMPFATMIMMALIIPLQMLAPIINMLMVPMGWLGTAMEGFNTMLVDLLSNWDTYLAPVFTNISAFFLVISTAWNSNVSPIFNAVKTTFALLGTAWTDSIAPIFSNVKTVFAVLTTAWDDNVAPIFDKAGTVMAKLQTAWNTYIVPVFNGIAGFFVGIVNAIIKVLNAPTQSLNDTFGLSLTTIPLIALARGGITQGPTNALIGDNPSGREAVIPLDDPKAMEMLGGGSNAEFIYETQQLGLKLDQLIYTIGKRNIHTL